MIEEKHIEKSKDYSALGPSYFAASELCENFFSEWEPENLEGIAQKVAEEISGKIHNELRDFIWDGQLESSLQSKAYQMVDDTVKALLTGEKWAIDRYVMNDRYNDGAVLREKLARMIPQEIQDKRIADLEAQLEKIKKERDEWIERAERRLQQY